MHCTMPRAEWSRQVVARAEGRCSTCGKLDDVRACYVVPPSLGGRNVMENGCALCGQCRAARDDRTAVRVSLSLDTGLAEELNRRAERGGRSVAEILRQLADSDLDELPAPVYPNGKPTSRISVTLSKEVYESLLGNIGHRARVGGTLAALVKSWLEAETRITIQEPAKDE